MLLNYKLERALVGRQPPSGDLNASAMLTARLPPVSQCSRWLDDNKLTNKGTNKLTNKHDGSQYLLAEVISV